MKHIVLILGLAVFVLAVTATAQTPSQSPSGSRGNPEIEAVRRANQEWLKAVMERNIARVMEFYAEDAVWLVPKQPVMAGKDAIRKYWESYFAGPDYALRWKLNKIEVSKSNDLASSFGTWSMKVKDEKGNALDIGGHCVVVWKKLPGGTWKVAIDTHNE